MDWVLVITLGAMFGGFHDIGAASVGYLAFWLILVLLVVMFSD